MRRLASMAACLALLAVTCLGENQLLFLQVVWRHGDRAPTETYPNDPHQEDAWPNGWGELTELGMLQHYTLGKLLRKRYIVGEKFLSARFNGKE
ncbi:Histidine acid phosphatase family protein, partial [Aphelenchoides avenae]